MNYGFWEKVKAGRVAQGEPFFVLAPMADVTDAAFRRIILECGRPDVFYTEFVSADGLMSVGRERLMKDLIYSKDEHPIIAQFFGAHPETIRQSAQLARELGFDGVDINMGCPDKKVVKQGAGIGLSRTPELAKEIIAAAKEGAGDIPLSIKTRLGYSVIDLTWIRTLLQCKIPALIIHGRTMKEMSKVPAHWDVIKEIAAMAKDYGTLTIGNGDVMSREEGIIHARESGVDGIMVGRGIFHNPWFFNPSIDIEKVSQKERLELLLKHTRLFKDQWSDGKKFDILKKFYKVYVSGWDGAKELRIQLMNTKTSEEVEAIISHVLK